MEEINTWSDEDKIICPYCGYEHNYNWDDFEGADLEFDDWEYECSNCGKEFYVGRSVSFSYETYKKEDE